MFYMTYTFYLIFSSNSNEHVQCDVCKQRISSKRFWWW